MSGWIDELPEAILAASRRIAPHVLATPLTAAPWADELDLWLKCEHLQHTGSFKLRGALNRLLTLDDASLRAGVIAASTGNHGQGVAWAARVVGVPVTVYVPADAAAVKIAPIEALGAEVVRVRGDGLAAELAAREAAEQGGRTFVSPYNDPWIVAGQGTVGLEIHAALDDVDAVFVAVGGGGLISGVAAYLKSMRPGIRVFGCWPENAPAMLRCIEAGRIHQVAESATLSDGTAGGVEAGAITFESCQRLVDERVLVSEREIAAAMRLLAEQERWIVEGSAAVALAGCLQSSSSLVRARVAVVLCGRNIALDKFLNAIRNA